MDIAGLPEELFLEALFKVEFDFGAEPTDFFSGVLNMRKKTRYLTLQNIWKKSFEFEGICFGFPMEITKTDTGISIVGQDLESIPIDQLQVFVLVFFLPFCVLFLLIDCVW